MQPKIIQGGMGVNISSPQLAKQVSMLGQQGTISGTMLEGALVNLLQKGDPNGNIRRALSNFPFQEYVDKVFKWCYVEDGKPKTDPIRGAPMFTVKPTEILIALAICANYAFVWLAKEGHDRPVSVNYLDKVAMPHVYNLTGAMMAGVDFVTMGAGIPLQIPEVIRCIAENETASYRIPVIGEKINSFTMSFNPIEFFGAKLPEMKKPKFLPIISSNLLASIYLSKLPPGSVHGFIVEEPSAGGHNSPPRNKVAYSEKDYVNYPKLAELGIPFWIGGSHASPEKVQWALSVGAEGIQAGSIFALSEESGMDPEIRRQMRKIGFNNELKVETDMLVSPTGYPFKKANLAGTISDPDIYNARTRICNRGGLVSLYEKEDGTIGYRCASEPIDKFVKKGGKIEDTEGRGCLCNGLFTTAGMNPSSVEPPVVTIGDDVSFLRKLMVNEDDSYGASDAIKYLLS